MAVQHVVPEDTVQTLPALLVSTALHSKLASPSSTVESQFPTSHCQWHEQKPAHLLIVFQSLLRSSTDGGFFQEPAQIFQLQPIWLLVLQHVKAKQLACFSLSPTLVM